MTGISIKEDKELADSIEEVYLQRDYANTILDEIYQIYYNGKMFANTKLPELIKQDREKAKKCDEFECKFNDCKQIKHTMKLKMDEYEQIVKRLDESIEALEKEKQYHKVHNPNATVDHQITWLRIAKGIRNGNE